MAPTTLATERLTLRPPMADDFPAFADFWSSDRSVGMGGPYDARNAWGVFCHDVALWPLYGHGALMIDVDATGETVGQVGINAGPLFPETELGWLLFAGQEGRGYATEAAAALRDWGFAVRGLATLVSYVDPDNHRSAAVALRLGAALDPQARGLDATDLVYRHPKGAA